MKYKKPKYVIEDKGPDGQYRFYFRRRKGQKKVRLHGLPYTPSFMAEYEAALKCESLDPVEPKSQKGTLAWACEQYCKKSIAFARLDERTAPVRRKNLDKICAERLHQHQKQKWGTFQSVRSRRRLSASYAIASGARLLSKPTPT
jgi:hypothetical protein